MEIVILAYMLSTNNEKRVLVYISKIGLRYLLPVLILTQNDFTDESKAED